MTEAEFQIVKSIGFVLAMASAVALQRLSPHRGLREAGAPTAGYGPSTLRCWEPFAPAARARSHAGRVAAASVS